MSASADDYRARAAAMPAELAGMSRSAAIDWGKRRFGDVDALFSRLERTPDGLPADTTAAAEAMAAWAEWLADFAHIVRDKPADPPRMVKLHQAW